MCIRDSDYFVPLSIIYEYCSSVYTSKKSFSLVDKEPPDKINSSSSGLYHLKRRTPLDKAVHQDMYSTLHIPHSSNFNTIDSTYLITNYVEEYSLFHNATNFRSPKAIYTSKINIESVKINHHNCVKDTTSSCVFRKRLYHRLCGTSLYEVSKYSYDDENNSYIFSLCYINETVREIVTSDSEERDS